MATYGIKDNKSLVELKEKKSNGILYCKNNPQDNPTKTISNMRCVNVYTDGLITYNSSDDGTFLINDDESESVRYDLLFEVLFQNLIMSPSIDDFIYLYMYSGSSNREVLAAPKYNVRESTGDLEYISVWRMTPHDSILSKNFGIQWKCINNETVLTTVQLKITAFQADD